MKNLLLSIIFLSIISGATASEKKKSFIGTVDYSCSTLDYLSDCESGPGEGALCYPMLTIYNNINDQTKAMVATGMGTLSEAEVVQSFKEDQVLYKNIATIFGRRYSINVFTSEFKEIKEREYIRAEIIRGANKKDFYCLSNR